MLSKSGLPFGGMVGSLMQAMAAVRHGEFMASAMAMVESLLRRKRQRGWVMLLLFSLCRNTLALSLGLALALFMCFTVVLSMFAADYYFTLFFNCTPTHTRNAQTRVVIGLLLLITLLLQNGTRSLGYH